MPTYPNELQKRSGKKRTRGRTMPKEGKLPVRFVRLPEQRQRFLIAYRNTLGHVSDSCKRIGITRKTFYEWRRLDQEFNLAVSEVDDSFVDLSECALRKQIKRGNIAAIIFALKTKGRLRGYDERYGDLGAQNEIIITIEPEEAPAQNATNPS